MILYLSNATAYPIYDRLFKAGKIKTGYQMQKFNDNLIHGLSKSCDVAAVSPLPYVGVSAERIDEVHDGIRYIGLKNTVGRLHKIMNIINLISECKRVIKETKPQYILCDAIARSPQIVSLYIGKKYHIPVVGIVTDLPGMLSVENSKPLKHIKGMQKFDGYILLTEQMNEVVNPLNKPYIVMEGLCAEKLPELREKDKKKIVLYTGSLWEKDAGIEYFVEGFIKAELENCELHLYGTGELDLWLEEIENQHHQIKYMGCVTNDEIVRLQCEATLLVNPRPSNEEFCKYSFPSKTIEYMASGTPVLMTRLPGVPDKYFDYVYTIEQEDADGVCKVLKEILQKPSGMLFAKGIAAREFVSSKKSCLLQSKRLMQFLIEKLAG